MTRSAVARRAGMSTKGSRIVAAMTEEELRAVVRESVEEASATDELLTQEEIAQKLKVSTGTVIKLRAHGMPVQWIFSSPRYCYADCREWVRGQKGGAQ